MSRLFPHTPYAEDQPLSKTILTTHVLHRGFQTGAAGGLMYAAVAGRPFWRRGATATATTASTGRQALLLRASGLWGLYVTAAMAAVLPLYMWNQTDIQWRDRSWRLMESKGQLETDDWSLAGTVVGVGAALAATTRTTTTTTPPLGRGLTVVGAAAVGNLVGVLGYMVWRYGVHGGTWPDDGAEKRE